MKTPHPAHSKSQAGVALVTTVIIIAVLAIVAVAFIQSTTVDRMTSRISADYTKAQLAADAGVADAMAQLGQVITNFSYVSGAEPSTNLYRSYVRATTEANGTWEFAGQPVYLDSGTNGTMVNLLISGLTTNAGVTATVAYKTNNVTTNYTNRYAFWVDEAGGKQNLSWWGGGGTRGLVTNVSSLPLVLPSADGLTVQALPPEASMALSTLRSFSAIRLSNYFGFTTDSRTVSSALITPATFNLVNGISGASSYFFTVSSPSTATTPLGGRKLNLQHLAYHISNNTTTAQVSNSTRAQLVEQLLQSNPPEATNWGGGDLNWLTAAGRYSATEQRQIVANLIDYLDNDLIPTTDSADSPTYFGVESRMDSSGNVQGHPYINFVSTGLIFNRSTASGAVGQLNSTRVLCSFGMVYPWSSQNSGAAAYTPEIKMRVEGTVLNPVPGLTAEEHFAQDLTDSGPLETRPIETFTPNRGQNWPQAIGMAGTASYSTPIFGASQGDWGGVRGPSNITFNNLKIVIESLRLRFDPSDGSESGYVQIIPRGQSFTNEPTNIVAGGTNPISLLVKFTEVAYSNTQNIYLISDPRANFRASSWTNMRSARSFSTNIPPPATGANAISITNGIDSENWDTAQGMTTNFSWYANVNTTNHFSRATTNFQSIGELGYIWTGKAWQTLNLRQTNTTPVPDWNLLDYVTSGFVTNNSTNLTVMPLIRVTNTNHAGVTMSNSLIQDGGFNILTRKLATVAAYLTNAAGITTNAASSFSLLPPPDSPSVGGVLALMAPSLTTNTTKFAQEGVVRAMANAAVTQSRVFTVYSRGESISGNGTTTVLVEADLFVDVNTQTGAPHIRVLSKTYH